MQQARLHLYHPGRQTTLHRKPKRRTHITDAFSARESIGSQKAHEDCLYATSGEDCSSASKDRRRQKTTYLFRHQRENTRLRTGRANGCFLLETTITLTAMEEHLVQGPCVECTGK